MALKEGGGLVKVSWVITEDQRNRIVEIFNQRKKPYNRVSQSDIAREIVEAGLSLVSHEDNIAFHARQETCDCIDRKSA